MDRLSFFKQGLSSVVEAASSLIGIKKAADSFTEAVNEALSEVRPNIGLHLPTLDNDVYNCVETTLDRIAQIGYTSIEVSAFYQGKVHLLPPAEFRALAKKAGLRITSAYLSKEPTMTAEQREQFVAKAENKGDCEVDAGPQESVSEVKEANDSEAKEAKDSEAKEATNEGNGNEAKEANNATPAKDPDTVWWEEAVATYSQLGCKYLTLAYQPEGDSDSAIENFVAYAKLISAIAAEQNMALCFHPRVATLTPRDGVSALDKIAAKCDAKTLLLEIDTYEAQQAGIEACELIKHFGKRVAQLHLHDNYNVGDSGLIDFDATLKEASRQGIDNIYIEVHCFTQPPINCVERSIQNVESLPSLNY